VEVAPRHNRKLFSIWRRSASLSLIYFDILLKVHPRNEYLYEGTKFDRSRVIQGWDMDQAKLFSKWRLSVILSLQKLPIWWRDLYVILHLRSQFRINWPIWRRDIAKNNFQYGVRPPSWIWKIILFVKCASGNEDFHLNNEFDRNWIITGRHYGVIAILKMAADRHLEFGKSAFLRRDVYVHVILHFRSKFRINRQIRRRDITKEIVFVYHIWWIKMNLNMASVRPLVGVLESVCWRGVWRHSPQGGPRSLQWSEIGWKIPKRTLSQCTAPVCVAVVYCWEIFLG